MPLFKMCRTQNAIDEVVFALVFRQEFDESVISNFINSLPSLLKSDFPFKDKSSRISFSVDMASLSKVEDKTAGIILRDTESKEDSTWYLKADSNSLVIVCRDYTRWETVWDKTRNAFFQCLRLINLDTNYISEIVLQCTDKFIEENILQYSITNLFNQDSKFLTKNAIDSGLLWHIHQGWYKESDDIFFLNILNISSEKLAPVSSQSSVIMHLLKTQYDDQSSTQLTSSLKNDLQNDNIKDTALCKIMVLMHEQNKQVLQSLLNDEALTTIGLKP